MSEKSWALILGASSGFGAATARELAKRDYNIFGVHLDRRSTLENVEIILSHIRGKGSEAVFFNENAANADKRRKVIGTIKERLKSSPLSPPIKLFMHSLAFGALKPFIDPSPDRAIDSSQMTWTLDVMAHSIVYWTQDLVLEKLLGEGSRIFAMTSSGGERVLPSYGAISAAKSALESHVRQLSVELIGRGISINAIRAGVTDTPALRKIPNASRLLEKVRERNPGQRATTTEDIAKAIAALAAVETSWLTGNVIGVDGGEHLVD